MGSPELNMESAATIELITAIVATLLERPTRIALSIDEAAKAISVSKRMMEELLATGQLRSKRIGSRRVIPVAALRRFVGDQ